jgi:hypothetical protein
MTRKIFVSLLVSLTLFTSFKPLAIGRRTEYVYICKGPKSVVYHKSETCRGLSHCSTKVEKVTLEYAIKIGRRACKIEY